MRALRFWLALSAALAMLLPAGTAGALDPRIERSRAELQRSREQAVQTTVELDRAAAEYEEAWAHLERLGAEESDAERDVTTAQQRVTEATTQAHDRLAALYKHPELRIHAFGRAVITSDLSDTLHQIELIDQLARGGAQKVAQADRVAGRVRAAEKDYRVVTAGVRDALRVRRDRATALGEALTQARSRVSTADAQLRTVEQTVAAERERERRERERARRQRLALAARGPAGGGPLPPVGGKACPVGAPNAFTDSWGAARSGGRSHQGADMFAAHGTALYALESGTIRTSDNSLGGVSVHLAGASGDAYYYAHLSQRAVVSGQRVAAGDVVGAVGNTGNARSTPPHLHFQYHPGGGAPVNPTQLLTALCR
ncbi:hypothetical protein BH23ACT10_BH23ACT10_15790 [soil metagenome]